MGKILEKKRMCEEDETRFSERGAGIGVTEIESPILLQVWVNHTKITRPRQFTDVMPVDVKHPPPKRIVLKICEVIMEICKNTHERGASGIQSNLVPLNITNDRARNHLASFKESQEAIFA